MQLCTRDQICDLLLEDYILKAEEFNPGLVERTITAVSGEVSDLLAYRYPQPWPYVPHLVSYIAAVFSAYRVVEAITSLVSSEGSVDNEWIPLQKQWKHCNEQLGDLAKGKLKLPFEEDLKDREDPAVAVISRPKTFNFRGF